MLLLIAGHGYFPGHILSALSDLLSKHNIYSLGAVPWWTIMISIVKADIFIISVSVPIALSGNNRARNAKHAIKKRGVFLSHREVFPQQLFHKSTMANRQIQ